MKVSLNDFQYRKTVFEYNNVNKAFETNYNRDFHLIIIWSKARIKEKEIIQDLRNCFNIIECFEISWTHEYIDDNFFRIYDVAPTGEKAGKREEVGDGPFLVILVHDINPKYLYRQDASGRLKIVNSNIVDKKNLYRNWVGGRYMVHSTDNIREFFNNAILLFGKQKVFNLIEQTQWDQKITIFNKNLIGSNEWDNINMLFETLNLTTEYVVLRGFEDLEKNISTLSGDIDILCSNIGEFTAVANARNIWKSKNFFHVRIDGQEVLFDIRYKGDGYFDEKWQMDIIENRILNKNGIYMPRLDDYFFSHLYHAYIHKPYLFEKYIERLTELSKKVGIENFKEDCYLGTEGALKLLQGYLLAYGYKAAIPKDQQTYVNIKFMSKLQKVNSIKLYSRVFYLKVISTFDKIILIVKSLIKKNRFLYDLVSWVIKN